MTKKKWLLLSVLALLAASLVTGLVYLDRQVVEKFTSHRWMLPARVFARPLELYQGLQINSADLLWELEALGYVRVRVQAKGEPAPGQYLQRGRRFRLHSRAFRFSDGLEPARRAGFEVREGRISAFEAGDGQAILRLEPLEIGGIYPIHGEDRLLLAPGQAPALLVNTLIAVEDRGFYRHHGISWRGLARALWVNLRNLAWVQGGSTLTQQLLKNLFLGSERSLRRKLLELPMAWLLELHYGKEEILLTYLNEIYLGQVGRRAIHGFGLASLHYFGLPLAQLEAHQIALLVALAKGPSLYDPRRNPTRARARRDRVLDIMAGQGVIPAAAATAAMAKPLDLATVARGREVRYPAYVDLVYRQLRRHYPLARLQSEGLQIFTALDPVLQRRAELSLAGTAVALERGYARATPPLSQLEGAVLVTEVASGQVLAAVGGRDPRFAGFNRALDARRPVGSLIKPAIYLAALERWQHYDLATLVRDEPLELELDDGRRWVPRNFDDEFTGPVLLHRGLAKSINAAAVNLGLELGLEAVLDVVRRLGVEEPLPRVPAMLLGAGELSPFEVTRMYLSIANDGFVTPRRAIRAVLTAQGESLQPYPLELEQRFDPRVMYLLKFALAQVTIQGTAAEIRRRLGAQFRAAGKTGTTNEQRDSWFAGFTGSHLVVVWLGRDDNGSTPLTGRRGALEVWLDLMAQLPTEPLAAPLPEGVGYHWVDPLDGLLSAEACGNAELLPFIEGTAPRELPAIRRQCAAGEATREQGGRLRRWLRKIFRQAP